ncbi:hypothetical protein BJ170DRAFT_442787 [Xylariales sp. AK1849]|nr:hypothetical protein BJ170DRAFT_442787 [Xylariales sp. AK1849]
MGRFRILTDPNFLHIGDHEILGPGVTAERRTDPAVDLHELPPLDCILLSYYHADHFDRKVEEALNWSFPIITTPHAKKCLTSKKNDPFRSLSELDNFESIMLHIDGEEDSEGGSGKSATKVTGTPGKHVPPGSLSVANDILSAVPPTNGWLMELGHTTESDSNADTETIDAGYRIYISGDTLLVDELKGIPKWLKDEKVDLMLVHLDSTTVSGPSLPLLMVTMDVAQGLELIN